MYKSLSFIMLSLIAFTMQGSDSQQSKESKLITAVRYALPTIAAVGGLLEGLNPSYVGYNRIDGFEYKTRLNIFKDRFKGRHAHKAWLTYCTLNMLINAACDAVSGKGWQTFAPKNLSQGFVMPIVGFGSGVLASNVNPLGQKIYKGIDKTYDKVADYLGNLFNDFCYH